MTDYYKLRILSSTYNENINSEDWIKQIIPLIKEEDKRLKISLAVQDFNQIEAIFAVLHAAMETVAFRHRLRPDFQDTELIQATSIINPLYRRCIDFYCKKVIPEPSSARLLYLADKLFLSAEEHYKTK